MRLAERLTLVFCLLCLGWYAHAQCLVPVPASPPRANQLIINLPLDGGSTGCTGYATSALGSQSPNTYAFGNAKCSTARAIADNMTAFDNGWNDGGTP